MLKFKGRLWNQGEDGSLYPPLDIAYMDASGALLQNTVKRTMQLVSQLIISASSRDGDLSNPIDGLVCQVKPISSDLRPDTTRLEGGSSAIAKAPNHPSSDHLSKDENAIFVATGSSGHAVTRAGGHQAVSDPQQSDDDLRLSGQTVALAYMNNTGRLINRETIGEWICRISLAADEGSVSNLSILYRFVC